MQTDLPLQPALQGGRQRLALALLERRGGGDRHVDHALGLVLQLIEQSRNLGEVGETPVLRERLDEIAALPVELRTGEVSNQFGQDSVADGWLPEQPLHS